MKIMKVALILSLISFVIMMFFLPSLPDQIPQHWNIKGEIDQYGSKYMMLMFGGLPIAMYLLGIFLPKIDPRKENYKKHAKSYGLLISILMIFFIFMSWIVLVSSLGYAVDTGLWVNFGIGILFVVIGNYMPKFRHNYFVGIKTPWTLDDEYTWNKTHRIGGYYFVISGLLFIIGGFINHPYVYYFVFAYILLGVVGLFAYSYIVYKNKDKRDR